MKQTSYVMHMFLKDGPLLINFDGQHTKSIKVWM